MMVNRRTNDAAPPQTPVAPVIKRKRRASCLGEQERRDRKRAIDREAQRSLREKTKSHIAELERTIQILRDQDRNGATASLLSEIDVLRSENERLRDVIDSVKSVVGSDLSARNPATANGGLGDENSPAATSVGHQSPKPRAASSTLEPKLELPTPVEQSRDPFDYYERITAGVGPLDLNGMTIMSDLNAPAASNSNCNLNLELEPLIEARQGEEDAEELPWGNDPSTAHWPSLMAEIFGSDWRPSPVILHIGNPESPPSCTQCPLWKASNDIYGKIFSYTQTRQPSLAIGTTAVPSSSSRARISNSDDTEVGMIFLGIQNGWHTLPDEWRQSPVLSIIKEADETLFVQATRIERLAAMYKSFKLLKYYMNATKEQLDTLPPWLRPTRAQQSTPHPPTIAFFAWPTLRDRLVHNHTAIFSTGDLSLNYPRFLRFGWPFAVEDAFYLDERRGGYVPSPLFEKYFGDLRYWAIDERLYDIYPEMRADIEGDRKVFGG